MSQHVTSHDPNRASDSLLRVAPSVRFPTRAIRGALALATIELINGVPSLQSLHSFEAGRPPPPGLGAQTHVNSPSKPRQDADIPL
jgi:hypothetical protein